MNPRKSNSSSPTGINGCCGVSWVPYATILNVFIHSMLLFNRLCNRGKPTEKTSVYIVRFFSTGPKYKIL